MPGFDGSGPIGQGAMTGRGMGYCNPARGNAGYGRGMGIGKGRGAGFRRFIAPAQNDYKMNLEERCAELEDMISSLKEEITALRQEDENSDK